MRLVVVEPAEQDVLKGDAGAGLFVEVDERIPQAGEVVRLVDLHDPVALAVHCGVEAQGEVELDLVVAQLPDHLYT